MARVQRYNEKGEGSGSGYWPISETPVPGGIILDAPEKYSLSFITRIQPAREVGLLSAKVGRFSHTAKCPLCGDTVSGELEQLHPELEDMPTHTSNIVEGRHWLVDLTLKSPAMWDAVVRSADDDAEGDIAELEPSFG